MSERYYPRGKLDQEQMNAIRLDTSDLSPNDEVQLRKEISRVHHDFIDRFGQYILKPLTDTEIAERFLFMEQDSQEIFENEWFTNIPLITHKTPEIKPAMTALPGDFVYGKPKMDAWDEVFSDEMKHEALEVFENHHPQVVKSFFNTAYRYSSFSHEISHFYQNKELPILFSECGAYYYQGLQENERLGVHFVRKDIESFYDQLIDKYGESVHKFFFGSLRNDEILHDWTPEVQQRLFPDMQIIKHVKK